MNMRDRLDAVGGTVGRSRSVGTTVTAVVPDDEPPSAPRAARHQDG